MGSVANAFRLAAVVLVTAFYGIPSTLAMLVSGVNRKRAIYRVISRGYCDKVLRVSGVSFRVEGTEKVDPTRPYVIVANHQSLFDPPVLICAFSQPLYFVLKKELFSVPFLGPTLRVGGNLGVDRGAGREAAESLLKGVKGLLETGGNGCLVVFPEGTRSRDGRLLPFRRGAFHAALMTRWPVVPVRIEGSRELLPPDSKVIRGGCVTLFVGDPIPTEALKASDLPALAERVRSFLSGEAAAPPSSPAVTPSASPASPSSAPPGHGGTPGPA